MRFRLELTIDFDEVGSVDAECDESNQNIIFHMRNRSLLLHIENISSFLRYVSNGSYDPMQLVIVTSLSQNTKHRFFCRKIAQASTFSLKLQTIFPTIPWIQELNVSSALGLHQKRRYENANADSFYGISNGKHWNRTFEAAFQYRLENSLECQIEGTVLPNQVFILQQPAIDFLNEIKTKRNASNIKLFSFETKTSRKFLVSDIDLFYQKYMETIPSQRHVYEIIQDNQPCHLYFDLEFKPQWNANLDGDLLVIHLKHLVVLQFYRKFGIHLNDTSFVDLVSTATNKFSRHLIVHAPNGSLFPNNLEVGQFVKEMLDDLADSSKFLVMGKDGATQSFIDTGVYTRNRAFRLLLSSKFGSDRILQRHPRCSTPFSTEKDFFLNSLICPIGSSQAPFLRCPLPSNGKHGFSRTRNTTEAMTTGIGCTTPYPALDAYVVSIASHGGIRGVIRSWQITYTTENDTKSPHFLTYTMLSNRYCRNIGRPHKSNNVMYVIDLYMYKAYQKCHDPECQLYKSPAMDVPKHLFENNQEEIEQSTE